MSSRGVYRLVAVVVFVLAAAQGGFAAEKARVIATAEGDREGTRVEITELKRDSNGIVTLKFTIINQSGSARGIGGYDLGDPDRMIGDHGSVGGVHLLDGATHTKITVDRDSEGKCVCTREMSAVPTGTKRRAYAKFSGVPAEAKTITVVIPGFEPVDDVPISD